MFNPALFAAPSEGFPYWVTLPIFAALILFGVGRGFYDCNTMPVLCQIARDDLRSTGYGLFNFASCLAGGVVAALAGALKSALGLSGAFQIAAGILGVSALLLFRIRKTIQAGMD